MTQAKPSLTAAVAALEPPNDSSADYVALHMLCVALATELDSASGRGTAATARELRIALAQLKSLRQSVAAVDRHDYLVELQRRAQQRAKGSEANS